jgi:uncharacterized SAM-binding protein YcdF (DUF218 family)
VFFVLSKILDLVFSPLTWVLAVLVYLAFRERKTRRVAFWVPVVTALVLYVFSVEKVSNALTRGLESASKTTLRPEVTYDTVVVLGGLVEASATLASGTDSYNNNVERMLAAYDLLRLGRAKTAILSGGPAAAHLEPEAVLIGRQLEKWGIAKDRIILESASKNTRENAVFSAQIIRERGFKEIAIVTSAFHMKRAMGCFRAVDLAFDTLTVDYRSYSPDQSTGSLLPRAEQLANSTTALREHFGWLVYRVQGYARP